MPKLPFLAILLRGWGFAWQTSNRGVSSAIPLSLLSCFINWVWDVISSSSVLKKAESAIYWYLFISCSLKAWAGSWLGETRSCLKLNREPIDESPANDLFEERTVDLWLFYSIITAYSYPSPFSWPSYLPKSSCLLNLRGWFSMLRTSWLSESTGI